MDLQHQLEAQGVFLFRYRSYIPLITLPLFYAALHGYTYPGGSHAAHLTWVAVCAAISLLGLAVRVLAVGTAAKGTSGRNVKHQMADELNSSGIYSVVRHPLYVGNFLIFFGISLMPRLWWLAILNTLLFWLFYLPIMVMEEGYLRGKFGERFTAWAQGTPTIVPNPRLWRPSTRVFSPRTALRREYHTLSATIAYYTLLEVMADSFATGALSLDPLFRKVFLAGLAFYLVVLVIQKTTRWLEVGER